MGHLGDVFLTEDILPAWFPEHGIGIAMFYVWAMLDLEVKILDSHYPPALVPKEQESVVATENAVVCSQKERTTEEVHSEFPEAFTTASSSLRVVQ